MSKSSDRGRSLSAAVICTIIGVYHVGAGVCGLVGGSLMARAAELAFGVPADADFLAGGQFMVLARFAGALSLAFGILMLAAATRPGRSRPAFVAAIVYFAVRLVTRIACAGQLRDAMQITTGRNVRSMVSMAVLLAGLVIFFPRERKAPKTVETP